MRDLDGFTSRKIHNQAEKTQDFIVTDVVEWAACPGMLRYYA